MSWDNKKDDWNLSVRTGPSIGKASENRMLDAMGGNDTIKKRLQTNADGSVTMAHTRGPGAQPEFITTNGSINSVFQCSLEMDSGVMDVLGFSPSDPNAVRPGKIYRTGYVAAHVDGKAKAVGAGKLKYPSPEGPVVAQGADSITPVDRKKLALKIPASLFTGRMRLYVQSLFGGNWSELVLGDASGDIGRPILSVNTLSRENKNLVATNIGSGCGIFFDQTSKRHCLIIPTATQAFVIPLQGSPCAERYRNLLFSTTLSDANKERIESYILSQSVPVPELAQVLDYPATPSEGLGYSWHFNWDGDKCDIVDVAEANQGGCWGFLTTHYNLTFTISGLNFSVARSIVSGPSFWTVPKNQNVIAYPDWFERKLLKAGNLPSGGTDISQSGSVYCFYVKNELKVINFVGTRSVYAAKRESSPEYFGGTALSFFGYLKETESGVSTYTASWTGYSAVFTLGGITIGGTSGSAQKHRTTMNWTGRTYTGGYIWDQSVTSLPPEKITGISTGKIDFEYTVTADGGITFQEVSWPQTYVQGPFSLVSRITEANWTNAHESYTEWNGWATIIVIPFMDAEAAYLNAHATTSRTGTRIWSDKYYNWGGYGNYDALLNGTHIERFTLWDSYNSGTYITGGSDPLDSSPQTTNPPAQLVCSHGTFQATLPNEGAFYSTLKSVSQMYPTLASVNGVVNAPDTGVQTGSPVFPLYSAYLGWA